MIYRLCCNFIVRKIHRTIYEVTCPLSNVLGYSLAIKCFVRIIFFVAHFFVIIIFFIGASIYHLSKTLDTS